MFSQCIFGLYIQLITFFSQFYLQLGSCLSLYGCFVYPNKFVDDTVTHSYLDTEQGIYVAPRLGGSENTSNPPKSSHYNQESHAPRTAGLWGYIFQILFQVTFSSFSILLV